MKKNLLPFLVFVLIISCQKKNTQNSGDGLNVTGTTTISLIRSFENKKLINASSFASKIEYVVLETNAETFYQQNTPSVFVPNSDQILVKSFRRISLFDRLTGKFIKDIGHFGIDPDSYQLTLPDLKPNSKQGTVYAKDQRLRLVEYDINQGIVLRKISEPTLKDSVLVNSFLYPRTFVFFGILDNCFIAAFNPNLSGKDPVRLVLYDFKGELIKIFNNHHFFIKKSNLISYRQGEGQFYNFNNKLMFKESFNDTVYNITADKMIPRYIFSLNEFSPPYSKKELLVFSNYDSYQQKRKSLGFNLPFMDKSEYMFISNLLESSKYLFFKLEFQNNEYMCYYDKEERRVKVSTSTKLFSGFYNDIDDFLPFKPTSINSEGELVGIVSAENVINWFRENPIKASSLPSHLLALQKMKPEDNPLVMIAKLK